MMVDISSSDVMYYLSLAVCIALGSYYKQISDLDIKRNYGTGLGILITYLLCGSHIYHSILITWGNIIIIKCCDKRYIHPLCIFIAFSYIHQLSISYTWTYLVYMHYAVEFGGPSYILWVHQIIALRLVGLAFEVYLAYRNKNESGTTKPQTSKLNLGDPDSFPEEPNAIEIIAYAYYFIGLHKGPYYRWKMFQDHFKTPFGVLGDCRIITEQKLKKALAYTVIFIFLRTNFPLQMYKNDQFYTEYGTDGRYLYNIPHLVMYCLQYQIIMMLCTSVCTECGFGVYPAQCLPLPGHGPSAKLSLIKLATRTTNVALEQEYNFAALRSFEVDKLIFGPRMRDTLRGWDMSIRYWYWAHTYKNISKSRKEVRSALSFLAWSIWCGPTVQQLLISSTLWVHTHLEAEYNNLYDPNASMKVPWNVGFSIMRLFCLIYLTPCLIIQDTETVLLYYNSIFWVYHILLVALTGTAFVIHKSKLSSTS